VRGAGAIYAYTYMYHTGDQRFAPAVPYASIIVELDDALADAEELGRSDHVEQLREEREALARELRASVGLGGRKRGLGDVSERARKAVTSRIRACLKKVRAVSEPLGAHLDSAVKTGTYCCYAAPEDGRWDVRASPPGETPVFQPSP